jgi:cephalosporin-C deacetylase-like acetyl esterase
MIEATIYETPGGFYWYVGGVQYSNETFGPFPIRALAEKDVYFYKKLIRDVVALSKDVASLYPSSIRI